MIKYAQYDGPKPKFNKYEPRWIKAYGNFIHQR